MTDNSNLLLRIAGMGRLDHNRVILTAADVDTLIVALDQRADRHNDARSRSLHRLQALRKSMHTR